MKKYLLKRFGYMLFTMFIVLTITYFLMHLIPGDPLGELVNKLPEDVQANYMKKYGLDQPVYTQYFLYLKNLVINFDLGDSIVHPGRSVNDIIKAGVPVSARIGVQGLMFGIPIGLILGILAAYKRGKFLDYFTMLVSLFCVSVPSFVLATVLQYFLAVKFQLFPVTGWGSFIFTVLPSIAFGIRSIGVHARYMRTSWLDVMNQDYVLAAESIGFSKPQLTVKVILRNALMPIVTIIIPELALIFTGTFVLEVIFSIPGIGSYFISSVTARDYPMIIGQTIFIAVMYIFAMFVVDMVYMLIDPRIRLADNE